MRPLLLSFLFVLGQFVSLGNHGQPGYASSGPPTYVGVGCQATASAEVTTFGCAASVAASGQTILVFASTAPVSGGPSALTDTGSYGSITSVTGITNPNAGSTWENLWVITNAGAGTHTLSFTVPASYPTVFAAVVSGASTTSPIDNHGSQVTASYACNPSATASAANDLAFEFDDSGNVWNSSTPTLTNVLSRYGDASMNSGYAAVSSSGAYTQAISLAEQVNAVCDLVLLH